MDLSKLARLKAGTTGKLSISPVVTVRWESGRSVVSGIGLREVITTCDSRLLQVLNAFATPRDPREVSNELASLGQGFLFVSISALWQMGALIEMDNAKFPDSAQPAQVKSTVAREPEDKTAHDCVQSLAAIIREIACDLGGFGPSLPHHDDAPGSIGSITTRLVNVHQVLVGVALELFNSRNGYLESQLAQSHLSGGSGALKLNLGSGSSHVEGWINIDLPPADLSMRLSWGLPFSDESAEFVYAAHVLEHLYYQEEALSLLKDIYRVLKPAGVLRLVVPDIEKCIRAYADGDPQFFETRKEYWPKASACETRLEHFLEYAGAGNRPNNFWGHKYGYDFETLQNLLRKAGFNDIKRSDYMKSSYAALHLDVASKSSGFKYRGSHYSLFVEVTK